MEFIKKLIKNKKLFQRTIGLNYEQFRLLSKRLEPYWEEAEIKRKSKFDRIRKIGGGNSYKFKNIEEKLLIILLYYKLYLTQAFLALMIGLDQANISKLISKMAPLIEKVADPELSTYLDKAKREYSEQNVKDKVNNWQNFLKKHPNLKDVSTDATEQKCFRSKDKEKQKEYYSGKKKQHSLKTQISVSSEGYILDVSKTNPGKVHDKSILVEEKTIEKFPIKTCQRLDSGYQGIKTEYPDYYIILPIKKKPKMELSKDTKELNTSHSKRRIIVENAFAKIKSFKICSYVYRGTIDRYNQTFRNIAAVINFRHINTIKSF